MAICYMCDQIGSTREHVPPLSFFPETHRTNLWTVRSCPQHNNDNALDVEYVRNSIVADMKSSGNALSAAQERMLVSFSHSPTLFDQTFREMVELEYKGQEVVVWRNDLGRFNQVMKAIAHGVYYKLFRKQINREWDIFYSSMETPLSIQGRPDGFDQLREIPRYLSLIEAKTPEPEVFQCAYEQWNEGQVFFRFIFYLGCEVHALSVD